MIAAYILAKLAPTADVAKVPHALRQPGITAVDLILGPWGAVRRPTLAVWLAWHSRSAAAPASLTRSAARSSDRGTHQRDTTPPAARSSPDASHSAQSRAVNRRRRSHHGAAGSDEEAIARSKYVATS